MRLYAFLSSPTYMHYPAMLSALALEAQRFSTTRQLNKAIAQSPPDILVAQFEYGFGNNYAGANLSNLDVSLSALQRYAPKTRVIVLVEKDQAKYVEKLRALFPVHDSLLHPVSEPQLRAALRAQIEAAKA